MVFKRQHAVTRSFVSVSCHNTYLFTMAALRDMLTEMCCNASHSQSGLKTFKHKCRNIILPFSEIILWKCFNQLTP
jgi:hypothetical protein